MTKMREAAQRAKDEEIQAGVAYRTSLDVVARKQNEFYTVRMPRVLEEAQRVVEEVSVCNAFACR